VLGVPVDEEIAAAWHAGRLAWPDVELDLDGFSAHVTTLEPGAPARFAADVYLVAACLAAEPHALAHLDRIFVAAARPAIRAIDANIAFIDDALQRLRTHLLVREGGGSRLAQYAARGPLRAWVGIAAARIALRLRETEHHGRKHLASDDDWPATLAAISTSDPELELLKSQYSRAFGDALRAAVSALDARSRSVLRMSFAEGASIDQIGGVYGVHRATAARWIERASDALSAETRRLLAEQLAVSGTELERIATLVRSQLDVSVSQLLPRDRDREP
jgi:RNA polymerase sigma-70 factor (ECF subfamily)